MRFSYHFILSLLLACLSHCSSNVNISGSAITTRYWDCCKPSCSWNGKAQFSRPVQSCDIHDQPLSDFTAGTGCNGGAAFSCTNQSPWAVNDTFSYGFAGVYIMDHVEDYWCCSCYRLNFTSGPVKGKTMIVQAHNTAYDIITADRFSLAIPGGNTSTTDACALEFNVSQSVFGESMVGVTSRSQCDDLPTAMKSGCHWRFDWFEDADNPSVDFERVQCPAALTNITGCVRDDEKELVSSSSAIPSISPFSSLIMTTIVIIVAFLQVLT